MRKTLALVAVLAATIAAAVALTASSFSSTTTSPDNAFTTGTVQLNNNGSGGGVLTLTNARPDDTVVKCFEVTYTGTVPASVRFYAQTTSTGSSLAPYLTTAITRGSFPGPAPANNECTGFTPDGGGGTVFNGKLSQLPATYDAGLVDPNASWTTNDKAVYRVQVTVDDTDDAQGTDATTDLVWEARNN